MIAGGVIRVKFLGSKAGQTPSEKQEVIDWLHPVH
jgi:hypothetical protein